MSPADRRRAGTVSASEHLFIGMAPLRRAAVWRNARWIPDADAAVDAKAFMRAKTLEMRQRHVKYEDTPYALEPNIKESPGGLRDLQVLRAWHAGPNIQNYTLFTTDAVRLTEP